MQTTDCTDLMETRESFYRFLAELYKTEIDSKMLRAIENMDSKAFAGTNMADGMALIRKYLTNNPLDPLTELAADFARVFLGAGIVDKELISSPYESVYTSPERLIMQDARDQVVAEYRKNGVDKVRDHDVPEDHLGTELEFMAHLCAETLKAGENATSLINTQKEFLNTHLLNWVPRFCEEVTRFANTDFYKGVASLTLAYLETDRDMLNELTHGL